MNAPSHVLLQREFLDFVAALTYLPGLFSGAIAQLGERLHGMQEVGGSIPPSSTKFGVFGVPIV